MYLHSGLVGITESYQMETPLHVALVCFIADPFDPPGYERYGGGHLFLFDLGRFLVQKGLNVSYFTRRNAPSKPTYERLGPLCSIHRLDVGPPEEIDPPVVGTFLDSLSSAFEKLIEAQNLRYVTIHSHYWIAGEVVRRFCSNHRIRHVHSILSLGRLNREKGKHERKELTMLRDDCEVRVFNSADALIAVCANEYADLTKLYPEVGNSNTHIIPYGVDPDVFYPRPESQSDFVRRQTNGFTQGVEPSI
jgi:glycosyltransferase involved in cell wall biosynthesis